MSNEPRALSNQNGSQLIARGKKITHYEKPATDNHYSPLRDNDFRSGK